MHLGRWVLITVAVLLFVACGGDEKSEVKVARSGVTQKATHLYYDGEIHGSVDGKSFVFGYKEGKNAELRTRGDVREFTIKFVAEGNIIVIIVNQYHGTGSYDKELNVIWQTMKNVGKLLILKEKKMLLEETEGGIISDFTITGETAKHKEIKIIGSFKLKEREH